jgi:hypothetical protein
MSQWRVASLHWPLTNLLLLIENTLQGFHERILGLQMRLISDSIVKACTTRHTHVSSLIPIVCFALEERQRNALIQHGAANELTKAAWTNQEPKNQEPTSTRRWIGCLNHSRTVLIMAAYRPTQSFSLIHGSSTSLIRTPNRDWVDEASPLQPGSCMKHTSWP